MAEKRTHWYQLDEPVTLDTPALLVYPDRVKQNISTAISMVNEVSRLRPHVKTNKSPDVQQALMISAGIQKFKCATIAEAEMLGICAAKRRATVLPGGWSKIAETGRISPGISGHEILLPGRSANCRHRNG